MNRWKNFLQEKNLSEFFSRQDLAKCNGNLLPLELFLFTSQKNKMLSALSRKTIRTFFVFALLSSSLFAQQKEVENLPKYDKQPIHFGFVLGLNFASFRVQLVDDFR